LIKPDLDVFEISTTLLGLNDDLSQAYGRSFCQTGRTGRLRMLTRNKDVPLFAYRQGKGWTKKSDNAALSTEIRSMIHVNVSRLSARYKSFERPNALMNHARVDHARHLVLQGEIASAEHVIQETCRITK
jgi:hypothetical protein